MIDLEILRSIKEGKSQETDENVLFGQYVGSSLQNMSPRTRPYVKMRIHPGGKNGVIARNFA